MTPGRDRASDPETSSGKRPRARIAGAGLGAELAASLVGSALVGLWIDHRFDTGPWGTAIAVTLGVVGGFYNFIRSSLRILHSPARRTPGSATAEKDPTTRDG